MNIKTNNFTLTKGKYFQIVIINEFKNNWWVFIAILFLAVILKRKELLLLIVFLIGFILIYNWFHSVSKKNKLFFINRYFEINDEFIIEYLEDGSMNKIKLSNIVKIMQTTKSYLLYISMWQFVYIPLNCLRSEEDRKNLDILLEKRI